MLKVAVVTQVKNESLFLPLWRRYYGGQFGYGNLFVINDGSTDGSTANLAPTRVLERPQRPFDESERALEISAFLEELLKFYDWVIYTDVDEFLVLDPLLKVDFQSYLQQVPGKHLNAIGINVLQNIHAEAEYSPNLPVFHQRRYGAFDRSYFKQLVHSYRVRFNPGFHSSNRLRNFAPGLYLMHLAHFDLENTRRRWIVRNSISWSENALENNHSWHFRMPVDSYLAGRYGTDPSQFAAATAPAQFMPSVLDFLTHLEREQTVEMVAETFQYQDRLPLLQFPPRFQDTIPAATAPLSEAEAAHQAPIAFDRDFDPEALYRVALSRVHGGS
jgi:hypothetical protein